MIEEAKAAGLTSEKTMWESIEGVEEMLCVLKREHPDEFWKFMRKQHGVLWKEHYSADFAEYDLSHIRYKDKDGKSHTGGHWTKDEVLKASAGKTFPIGTTDCDKWVAYNVMYADLCRVASEDEVLRYAHEFFFNDDDFDYSLGGKIWRYVTCNHR